MVTIYIDRAFCCNVPFYENDKPEKSWVSGFLLLLLLVSESFQERPPPPINLEFVINEGIHTYVTQPLNT